MASGGARTPAKPAPASGPGRLSARTDGGPAAKQKIQALDNAAYGEQTAFHDQQAGAPMEAAAPQNGGGMPSAPQSAPSAPQVPFHAPTQRPDEPVTSGAPVGPGPGPESLGLNQATAVAQWQSARDMITALAQNPSSSPALQYLAGKIQGGY